MNKQIYGIKSIYVNNHLVHTFKMRFNNNETNRFILESRKIKFYVTNSNKIIYEYSTMNTIDFEIKVKQLGIILKLIAQNNLNQKYQWTQQPLCLML